MEYVGTFYGYVLQYPNMPTVKIISEEKIITTRLKLRSVETTDENFLIKLWTDKKVRKYLGGSIEENKARQKVKNYVGKKGYFIVTDLRGGRLLGLCSLDKYRTGEIEISYELLPEAWNKGFGQDATLAVIEWGFKNMNIDHIIAVTQRANIASRKMLESIGMLTVDEFMEFGEPQIKYSIKS